MIKPSDAQVAEIDEIMGGCRMSDGRTLAEHERSDAQVAGVDYGLARLAERWSGVRKEPLPRGTFHPMRLVPVRLVFGPYRRPASSAQTAAQGRRGR